MSVAASTPGGTSLPHPYRCNAVWTFCRLFLRVFFTLLVGFRARGMQRLPVRGGMMLLVNHQSNFDPLLVGLPLSRPVSYMARKTLFDLPFLGWILQRTYVVPIDREAAKAGAIRVLVERMQHGFMVGMFPEGTRTHDGSLGEFKPGFLVLLRRTRLPIQPVGIAGAFEAYPRGHWPRPGRVRVVFGEPWLPEDYEEFCERGREADLVAEVSRRVQDCVQEATEWRSRC